MASEFESRQAFLLVDAQPGYYLRFDTNSHDIPSFSIEPEETFVLIPVSPGSYHVDSIEFKLEEYKINLVSLKKSDGSWVKKPSSLEDAELYIEEHYPVLKLDIVEK